jgi:hypothetical protein
VIDQDGAGGSAGDEVAVDPVALREMARGLTEVLGELKKLGAVESADLGDNFDAVNLTGMQLGSSSASSGLGSFGYHWKWEVRSLFAEGNELAEGLGLAAGSMYDNDQYIKGTFKDLVVDGMGNPDESDDQVAKQSLSSSLSQMGAPDESAAAAKQHMTAAWKAEAADEVRSNPNLSIVDRLTGGHLKDATAGWDPNNHSALHPEQNPEGGAR